LAENSNNENTRILHDSDVTNQYLQEFVARYVQFGGADMLVLVDVGPVGTGVPRTGSLAQNFPNLLRMGTSIVNVVPTARKVELRLYDVQGRELQTLVNQRQSPGRYAVDLSARGLASGVYF
jgi:hypothetical protein